MEPPSTAKPEALPALVELDLLIRARYPILYVVTWEELRVCRHLEGVAQQRGKQLYLWSVTTGLQKAGSTAAATRAGRLADPVESLNTVIEHKEPAIYVFRDLHPFIAPGVQNVAVVRKLREVAQALSDSYKTLIVTAPVVLLAPDLEKDVTVLDYPLPGVQEFSELLTRICRDVSDSSGRKLTIDDKGREKLTQAALGLTLQEAENVFAKTVVSDRSLSGQDVSVVFSEKQQIIRKSGLLEYFQAEEDIQEVGGLENLKQWLARRSVAFSERARKFGLPAPKGVLMVGVQGCGKSLCAKAVSRLWGMPLLRFDVGRMFSSLVGSSEENIRRALAVAESIAPVVLWVDEIDKAFAGIEGSAGTDGGTTARVMSTFLTWMSEKRKPVFVLATANSIARLPPELLRKGRFDEIFFVDLPTAVERRRIFEIHLAKRRRDPKNFQLDGLVEGSEGFSGAEIEQAVISALYDAFYVGGELETDHVLKSLQETVPLSRTMSENISTLRGWATGRARFASESADDHQAAPRRKLEFE
jgi:AAA+ superfamily predicted ATPase